MRSVNAREVVVSEYVQTIIRVKARQLCRRPCFSRSDEDQLKQDLILLLLTKLEQFNPELATLNTFIDRVVESGARMAWRAARRQKRGAGRNAESLDAAGPACPEQPLRDSVQQDAHSRRTGSTSRDPRDEFVDRDAIEHAINRLPEELRPIARLLMEFDPTPLASKLGMSRRQMRVAISTIRQHFVRAGFGNDDKSRTPPPDLA